ncbi:MAG: hypothetical protein AAGG07_00920 [Planctomycetota bacterium]
MEQNRVRTEGVRVSGDVRNRRPPTVVRAIGLSLATLIVLICPSTGCVVVQPAEDVAGASLTAQTVTPSAELDLEWPERLGGVRGLVVPLEPTELSRVGARLRGKRYLRPTALDRADAAALASAVGDEAEGLSFEFEGPGSYVFGTTSQPPKRFSPLAMKVVSARPPSPDGNGWPTARIQRTWFAYERPRGEPRAVVLLMPGMFGTPGPILNRISDSFRLKDIGVLRMLGHPSRFTEQVRFGGDAQPPATVEAVARELDDRVAEAAYAAWAAIDHLRAERPETRDVPLVLMGGSGGAMILPTVAAYRPGEVSAAILVAGGAGFVAINEGSNYAGYIRAIDVSRVPAESKQDLFDRYRAASSLDGVHTAEVLKRFPTLMIHGTKDKAVPAEAGERLWELAGRPERWTYPLGHELLFLNLVLELGDVNEWLNEALARPVEQP